ncbi:hypothetical protein A4A49_22485 [Nicotiana attenuata]|uniref:G-patch domain-containing protein n=1 Tax=Nicotiana attenuata TaxID=49451 RepID=A0A1J6L0M2_NICAT|nr:hypothetical protein A4A49_22485 [Nicotiana attenuata]
MQTIEIEETEQNLGMQSPYRSKMAMREMMKYGYRLGTGIGTRSEGITKPIELNGKKGRVGIGYQPPMGKTHTGSSGKKAFVPEHVSGTGQSLALEDNIIEGMGRLFVAMIEECYEGTNIKRLTIRIVEQGEGLGNRTASPSLVRRESW